MDSNSLVVLASVLGTLTAVTALGSTALVTAAYMRERSKRQAAEEQNQLLRASVTHLEGESKAQRKEIKRLAFIRGNKLYSRAQQDAGFAIQQSLTRLRVLKADIDDQITVIENTLDAKE